MLKWAGVALYQLVRKVFGQIASKEFVSCSTNESYLQVLYFSLDFQYGQDKELNFGPAGDVYYKPCFMYGNTGSQVQMEQIHLMVFTVLEDLDIQLTNSASQLLLQYLLLLGQMYIMMQIYLLQCCW